MQTTAARQRGSGKLLWPCITHLHCTQPAPLQTPQCLLLSLYVTPLTLDGPCRSITGEKGQLVAPPTAPVSPLLQHYCTNHS